MENLSFNIATVNGTGSLSANQLLTRMIFRSQWTVGSYNFFPSNIAGLPCLYNLRLNSKGYTAFCRSADLLFSLNPKSLLEDLKDLKPSGLLITDSRDKAAVLLEENKDTLSFQGTHWAVPLSESLKQISGLNIKTRPLLKNMIYVGMFSEWLKLDESLIQKTMEDFFQNSKGSEIVQKNLSAIQIGRELARQHSLPFSLPEKALLKNKEDKILIEGNTAQALGALFSGCQFLSWYPITPATSLAESFERLANTYQKDSKGQKKFLVLQAEDELAGISQALGAGWAGLRAMTATSGPGLSLMSEAAGLSYFAEIPMVLCNVQRAGPSTGLPTRTQQGDLLSAGYLSHGDSKHIVLLPGNPEEAFQFTAQAFDLAEQLQTLVIVLSDLDLGMNLKISHEFPWKGSALQRGKILKEKDLDKKDFIPYGDVEADGISYRTLPGVCHAEGAYLNRGSGHNEKAEYSEKPQDYSWKLDKLKRKWETAKTLLPEPVISVDKKRKTAFVTFGPNRPAMEELKDYAEKKGIPANSMRVRSFPFPDSVEHFLAQHSEIFVVEQNRDGQLKQLLASEFPQHGHKLQSLLQYDGCPLDVVHIQKQFDNLKQLGGR